MTKPPPFDEDNLTRGVSLRRHPLGVIRRNQAHTVPKADTSRSRRSARRRAAALACGRRATLTSPARQTGRRQTDPYPAVRREAPMRRPDNAIVARAGEELS